MSLQAGIVGMPNVGKSTLFNALTNAKAQAANYPFCTIEPNLGVITVPDRRLNKLAELVKPKSLVPNTVEIVDIAGLVKDASKGEGLGNQFLGNIRSTDAILHVIRCFEDPNIVHVSGSIDPVRDKEIIDTELQLRDLETLQKKIDQVERTAKSGDKSYIKNIEALKVYDDHLSMGKQARSAPATSDQKQYIKELSLLTDKPIMYICNIDEAAIKDGNKHTKALQAAIEGEDAECLLICGSIESDIAQLDPGDRQEFLDELGLKEPGLVRMVNSTYKLLKLNTFFTASPQEVRAWTVRKGTHAPQAAGVIHSDFEAGFIRAEVIRYEDYANYGSEQACKEAGKLQVEGKGYVVQDGDVMHFRFNV